MPIGCLITIEPIDVSTGNRVTIYVASANDRRVTGLNNVVWEPAITQVPSLTVNLWNGDFQAAPDPGNAVFAINMMVVKQSFPAADQYAWIGAPVRIWAEEIGTAWPWTQRFLGRVASISRRDQNLAITAKVETETFAKNVLTATYGGTGWIEGGADVRGRVKPLVLGWAQNVEPVLIDSVNSVYQFSAYGPIEAVSALYERASDFGASVGDFATYAALVAASIPAGRWATCLASGLVRLGAPAYGVITGDVRGHRVGGTTPRLTGAVINALATIAGVSAGNLNTASLSALDVAVPFNVNLVLMEQVKFVEIATRMALACNYQASVSLLGQFFVSAINLAASPALTINARGRASPQVLNPPDELEVSLPYWKIILGANRSWRAHTLEEIALAAPWVERGAYSGGTTYREGNVVSLSDGSRYAYIAATASAGNAPPNASFWALLSSSPTVVGVIGQGAWATYTAFTPEQVTNPGANLIFNSSFNIGSLGWVVAGWQGPFKAGGDVGAWFMTCSANDQFLYTADVTKQPVFAGQTYTFQVYAAANGTSTGSNRPYFYIDWHNSAGGFISSSGPAFIDPGVGYRVWSTTATAPAGALYARVVMNSNKVATGGGSVYTSKWKLELGGAMTPWSDEATNGALYQTGQTIDALKPAEVNANVTETRVAAAIAGQGDLATTNRATLAFGDNAIVNSEFTAGANGLANWAPPGAPTVGYLNLPGWFGRRNVAYMRLPSTTLSVGQMYDFSQRGLWNVGDTAAQRRNGLAVKEGDTIYARALIGVHRCLAQVYILIFDSNGNLITAPNWTGGRSMGGEFGDPANFDVVGGCTVVSGSTAATAQFMIRMLGTGGNDPYVFFTEPAFGILPAGQTTLPPYKPGRTDPAADQTSTNTAAAIAGQGDLATQNRAGLPFGTDNRVRFSLFEKGTAGWQVRFNSAGLANTLSAFDINGGRTGKANWSFTAAGQTVSFGTSFASFYAIPVTAGETLAVSVGVEYQGPNTGPNVVIGFLNASGGSAGSAGLPFAGSAILGFANVYRGIVTVPAGAVVAYIEAYSTSTGAGAASIAMAQPMVIGVASGQTVFPAFTPGPGAEYAADVTGANVAAGIVGQGTGATASTLAGLDPSAAATLSALTAGSTYVAAVGSSFQMFLTAGQAVALSGRYGVLAGGSSSGSLQCILRARVKGGSYSTFATGNTVSIGPTEPGASNASGTFTNSTGLAQVFEFTVDAIITPGTAGGPVDEGRSYIKV